MILRSIRRIIITDMTIDVHGASLGKPNDATVDSLCMGINWRNLHGVSVFFLNHSPDFEQNLCPH